MSHVGPRSVSPTPEPPMRIPPCTVHVLTGLWNHGAGALGPSLCGRGFTLRRESQCQAVPEGQDAGRGRRLRGPQE